MGEELNIRDGNPYYISKSDNPNTSLVTTLLNGSNYQTWSIEFQRALFTKNKSGFIDVTYEKLEDKEDDYTIP